MKVGRRKISEQKTKCDKVMDLVGGSLFNGISTFVGYSMLKLSL